MSGSTSSAARAQTRTDADLGVTDPDYYGPEEHTTETRRSAVTSELWIFLLLSVVILFFAYESGGDSFSRDDGWRYVTWLGVGYLVSRGLAKAGSYESYLRGRER